MDQLPLFFFLSVVVATTVSFLAVVTWTAQRRKERESYYRAEMLEKVAESPERPQRAQRKRTSVISVSSVVSWVR